MDETYTLLRLDVGHRRTVEFRSELKSLQKISKIKIIHVTQDILEKTWYVFEKYSDKYFSFTDCTSFITMQEMKIKEVFSFDKHFEQYGLIKLPVL
ncbi:MAG: PIN domain-containing protein [Candidatus Marinimicrobia bacterium]|nr:PIN domain-containing protein [Candidatus Neomarinimicrobiota bacterium]